MVVILLVIGVVVSRVMIELVEVQSDGRQESCVLEPGVKKCVLPVFALVVVGRRGLEGGGVSHSGLLLGGRVVRKPTLDHPRSQRGRARAEGPNPGSTAHLGQAVGRSGAGRASQPDCWRSSSSSARRVWSTSVRVQIPTSSPRSNTGRASTPSSGLR